jgi:hypothetical protein
MTMTEQGPNEQRRRGQLDAAQGLPANYGCHYGMRSTLERDRADYKRGYDEVEQDLRIAQTESGT